MHEEFRSSSSAPFGKQFWALCLASSLQQGCRKARFEESSVLLLCRLTSKCRISFFLPSVSETTAATSSSTTAETQGQRVGGSVRQGWVFSHWPRASETRSGVPIKRNTRIPECVWYVTNMSENSIDIHFFSGRGSFHAEGTKDHITGRADVSSARDDCGLHMFAFLEGTDGPSKCAWLFSAH